jgi:hypothetical protein
MKKSWLVVLSALLFIFLFYKQGIGLNLLIFEIFLAAIVFIYHKPLDNKNNLLILTSIMIISALFFVVHFTWLALIINFIAVIVVTAYCLNPNFKSLHNAFPAGISNSASASKEFLKIFNNQLPGKFRPSYFSIFILPLVIVIFYLLLYSFSSINFLDVINSIGEQIAKLFSWDISYLQVFLLFVSGLFVTATFLYPKPNRFIKYDADAVDYFIRIKNKLRKDQHPIQFVHEYRAGVFLFLILNILSLLLNVLDVYHVWFNFKWEGQFLKQFVHEGTYMLIFSILLAVAIILYFFRGNMHFYKRNKWIKILAIAWLTQNAILAVSVAIRNFWYIQHYALAYKRIGVFFFLVAVLILIISVIIKISNKRSFYYLLKVNSWSVFLLIFLMAAFNWDNIIARYNFSNSHKSFLHLDFLVTLPDKSLHILHLPLNDLERISVQQNNIFPHVKNFNSIEHYNSKMQRRVVQFQGKIKNRSFLSWNYAEYKAAKALNGED